MKTTKGIVEKLNKALGEDVALIGDEVDKVEIIPTGILALDFALGIGGIPRGRVTDLYSLPSVGKSTLCYTIIANAQKMGLTCAIIDGENSYTKEYVEQFGVDTSSLIVVAPPTLELAGEAIESLTRERVALIVVDSVSSLIPKALAEAEHGVAPMARQARGMSQMMLKLIHPLYKNKTALITINQMRVNLMATAYMDKYTITGGFAIKFYSSIRIEMKRKQAINLKDEQIGYVVGFKTIKNKLSRPQTECEIPYLYNKGFDPSGDMVQMAIDKGIFEQKGAWVFHGETKWNGKKAAEDAVNSDPELRSKLTSLLFPQQS